MIVALLLILTLLMPATSQAARLFTCGFEEGILTTTTMWAVAGAGTSVVTTTPHSGTYTGKNTGTTGKSFQLTLNAAVTSGTYFTRFYWQTNATGVGDSRIFRAMSQTSVGGVEIYKVNGGTIRLSNVVASTSVDSSAAVSINTWYRLELKHVISDTVGYLVLNIYNGDSTTVSETLVLGASDANGTGANADTLPTNIDIWSFDESLNSSSLTYLWDDIAINDATGSFQTSYPGAGKTFLLVPDSNVSMTWEAAGGAANSADFAQINDLGSQAIDDTKYNAADTTLDALDALGNTDQLGLTNLGAEVTSNAVLAVIHVYGRIGSNQTSSAKMQFDLWDEAATKTNGPFVNTNVNGWKITTTTESYAYNAAAKTKANLDSFNVGYEDITDTIVARPRRISAIWLNVEWLEAPASGTILQQNTGFLPTVIR